MAKEIQIDAARRAWTFVLVIVFVMSMLTASLLLLLFDASMLLVVGTGLLLATVCTLLIASGYHVVVPTVKEIEDARGRDDLKAMAAALFISVVDDESELRMRLYYFVEVHRGSRMIWVAPPRLLTSVARIGVVPRTAVLSASKAIERGRNDGEKPKVGSVRTPRKL